MKLKNTFVQGKMNKDIDERLLPKGQYPHAENIRVANTDGSDMGAIENVRGNKKLTDLSLTDAITIGKFSDGSNQKVYWFVSSDTKDLVMEYDIQNSITSVLLESSNPNGVLNFDRDFLITGVTKIINGDSSKDLLIWTDDLNDPRCINIERAKTYGADGFDKFDINLIKRPPLDSPTCTPSFTPSSLENNLENKFYSFAYRYVYLDGEYSALSSFSDYQFYPSEFELDFQTMENSGMVNSFNSVDIAIKTGDKRVTDVEVVFKESNSSTVYLVETFNKDEEGWSDNEEQTYRFFNNKVNIALPQSELFRLFDNVPRKAKALELIGTRLAFGNYVEQYDLKNIYGQDISIDYSLSLSSVETEGEDLEITRSTDTIANDSIIIDLAGFSLNRGNRITLSIDLEENTYGGSFGETFSYVLNRDFETVSDLILEPDFVAFVQEVMSQTVFREVTFTNPPADSIVLNVIPFEILSGTASEIIIKAPIIVFEQDTTPGTPDDPENNIQLNAPFFFTSDLSGFYSETAVASSLKTNRSYEVGIVYLDEYGRSTTVLTNPNNTIYIPQDLSTSQNKIIVNINNQPPSWAIAYRIVLKGNKDNYQTIYTNLFYEDGLFRWVKLEGANVNKVQEGDTLIVKSDLGGPLGDIRKVRVLEVALKEANFLEEDTEDDEDEVANAQESGLYMKIKPRNIAMNFTELTVRTYEGGSHLRYPVRTFTSGEFGEFDEQGVFTPFELNAGSRVTIDIKFRAKGSISYSTSYNETFRVNGNYSTIKDWFESEVKDLGSFGDSYTWDGVTDIGNDVSCGQGQAQTNNYISGYGFGDSDPDNCSLSSDPQKFYVVPHRKGTASRNITSSVNIEIVNSDGILIFETEPSDNKSEIFFETSQTFDIIEGRHQGNLQNQTDDAPTAIVELDAFNCYVQGNGAESYRYKDAFNVGTDDLGNKLLANYLNIDLRPNAKSPEKYKEVRRFADITYSEPYNENTGLNRLNEFNLSKANFKEDIDRKYGYIQHLYSRDTDLVVFQEDKVSKVLYGKDVLNTANGGGSVSTIEDVLGQQVTYGGEYGISRNPESFDYHGYNMYFTDSKRGSVCRLGRDGITEISMAGMKTWFRDEFRDAIYNKKLGTFDPYYDQYVVHSSSELLYEPLTIDCSEDVTISKFQGVYILNMDFGITLGQGYISFNGNGLPVKYTIKYDNFSVSTGFLGDPQYNEELVALGLPEVSAGSEGTLNFNKNKSLPRFATIEVEAPLCNTDFSIQGNCLMKEVTSVITVILGDAGDLNRKSQSLYRWSNDSYESPFTTYNTTFTPQEVQQFDVNAGFEGSNTSPLNGSTVRMVDYNGFNQTVEWVEGENKMGYLVSNTLYTEQELETLITSTNFLQETTTTDTSGNVTRFIEFDYNNLSGTTYLYLVWDYRNEEVAITQDTKIFIYFDNSGSMINTFEPLDDMASTILKDRLLPLYNNDGALYDSSVVVESIWGTNDSTTTEDFERSLRAMNMFGQTPDGNVIVLLFQDESIPNYHGPSSLYNNRTTDYDEDIAVLRGRLSGFEDNYYRGVVFQVIPDGTAQPFRELIQSIQNGTGLYSGVYGLSDRPEFNYKYNILDGGTPQYYLDRIVEALEELGYEL